jgi:hypothetical protein
MVHVLKSESIVTDEPCKDDVLALQAFRVKTAAGHYTVVLASSEAAAQAHAKALSK